MEELKEYNIENLSKRDTTNLNNLINQDVASISKLIAAIQDLSENINSYKECLIDYINIETEILDIKNKYKTNSLEGKGVGVGNLPGVYTQPQGYNLEEIKQDSLRVESLAQEEGKVKTQRDNYFTLCREDIKLLIEYWKSINRANLNFDNYILELAKIIN